MCLVPGRAAVGRYKKIHRDGNELREPPSTSSPDRHLLIQHCSKQERRNQRAHRWEYTRPLIKLQESQSLSRPGLQEAGVKNECGSLLKPLRERRGVTICALADAQHPNGNRHQRTCQCQSTRLNRVMEPSHSTEAEYGAVNQPGSAQPASPAVLERLSCDLAVVSQWRKLKCPPAAAATCARIHGPEGAVQKRRA
ncbi:hypothetical protein SKAU_G00078540 [Synaphobranchus kaupii]|uniref:Uncharacterized protein n=1 Tax=Synaphobranchus kaupii TaxID=118154 RepID=A0A9Q1FUE3_SYNKA|nr:hypothetical protein SKAU_G00078540 [Synaphobranchus kaupii]